MRLVQGDSSFLGGRCARGMGAERGALGWRRCLGAACMPWWKTRRYARALTLVISLVLGCVGARQVLSLVLMALLATLVRVGVK